MEQLLMELRFAPAGTKARQAEAAEGLLGLVKKDIEYPYEFVCYQITGYRPKGRAASNAMIRGDELIDDLRVFVRKLSAKAAQDAVSQGEKVYTVEELAAHFGVSLRTIERWRKRGLGGRQFVFPDGTRKTGFTESNVTGFVSANERLVQRARKFATLTDEQRDRIFELAREMVQSGSLSRKQIIAEIAAELKTSGETVRYHLVRYETENPQEQLFAKPAGVITPQQMREVVRRYQEGAGIQELMQAFHRSRSSIYRIINAAKAREFVGVHMEYVDSDDFVAEGAELEILGPELPAEVKATNTLANDLEAGKTELHDYLQALKDVKPLPAEMEKQLFRRYNYLKYRFNIARLKVKPGQTTGTQVKEMQSLLTEARAIGLFLRQSYLRVVVTVAQKHHIEPEELRSYLVFGNKALTKALETYDFGGTSRFSNFASLTIAKEFALAAAKGKKPSEQKHEAWERGVLALDTTGLIEMERSQRKLVNVIEQNLDERERFIITSRYDVEPGVIRKHKKTLNEVGAELGVAGEEVRRLELAALGKLRHVLSDEEFARLTEEGS